MWKQHQNIFIWKKHQNYNKCEWIMLETHILSSAEHSQQYRTRNPGRNEKVIVSIYKTTTHEWKSRCWCWLALGVDILLFRSTKGKDCCPATNQGDPDCLISDIKPAPLLCLHRAELLNLSHNEESIHRTFLENYQMTYYSLHYGSLASGLCCLASDFSSSLHNRSTWNHNLYPQYLCEQYLQRIRIQNEHHATI